MPITAYWSKSVKSVKCVKKASSSTILEIYCVKSV